MIDKLAHIEALFAWGAIIIGVAVWLWRTFAQVTLEQRQERALFIQEQANNAYHAVAAATTKSKINLDDFLAMALKKVAETAAAQTGKSLTAADEAAAKLKLEAIVGQQIAANTPPKPPV